MPLYVFTRLGIRIGVGELRLKDAGGLITGFAQGVTSRTQHKVDRRHSLLTIDELKDAFMVAAGDDATEEVLWALDQPIVFVIEFVEHVFEQLLDVLALPDVFALKVGDGVEILEDL